MKAMKLSLVAAVAAVSLSAGDIADITSNLKVSGDATFTTNGIWRGQTFTHETPTVQSTLTVEHSSGAYVSVWGTGNSAGSEIDFSLGYATEVSGVGIDAGFVDMSYTHPDRKKSAVWKFDESGEIYVSASKTAMDIDFGATIYQEILADDDSTVLEASASKDFGVVYANVTAGYHVDDNYHNYYSLTVGKAIEAIKGDVSLTAADATGDGEDMQYAVSYTTSF
ncbi:Conserved hypothetical protein 2001 [hydrothermal vent metagenome]|uniref:Porin domain-containing protein n=1 Tax=hydrothermal vent metagenome TaxID=652676 RepID=A0A1W1D559_9ZZZZ